MIRRPPRSTPLYSSAASDVYKRQVVSIIDTVQREYFFDTLERCHGKGLVAQLAEVVVAAAGNDNTMTQTLDMLRELNNRGGFDEVPFESVWNILQALAKSAE